MAAGYRLIGRNRLIPRPTFKGRHREYVKDPNSIFENSGDLQYIEFDVLECVVQPLSGRAAKDYTAKLMQEGGKQYDSFTVYSSTPLRGPREGSTQMADQIFLKDSTGDERWFTVIKSDIYQSTGVSRYRAFVVSTPPGTEGGI